MAESPVFTICPLYAKGYKDNLLKEKYGLSTYDIMEFNYPSDVSNSIDFYDKITYNVSEMVKYVKITTQDISPEVKSRHLRLKIFYDKIKGSNGVTYDHKDFFTSLIATNEFGRCHTLNIKSTIKTHLV